MHETSLGGMIVDYLTGEELEETTFEEFRQGLAKFLVEERGYPKERVRPKVMFEYEIDGEQYGRLIDMVVEDDSGAPLMLVLFCPGEIGTYEREAVSLARLIPGGPVPLVLVSDSIGASLLECRKGECLRSGMEAVPAWEELLALSGEVDRTPMSEARREKELRIFHTYNGFLFGYCGSELCRPPAGKRPRDEGGSDT